MLLSFLPADHRRNGRAKIKLGRPRQDAPIESLSSGPILTFGELDTHFFIDFNHLRPVLENVNVLSMIHIFPIIDILIIR